LNILKAERYTCVLRQANFSQNLTHLFFYLNLNLVKILHFKQPHSVTELGFFFVAPETVLEDENHEHNK